MRPPSVIAGSGPTIATDSARRASEGRPRASVASSKDKVATRIAGMVAGVCHSFPAIFCCGGAASCVSFIGITQCRSGHRVAVAKRRAGLRRHSDSQVASSYGSEGP
jgi:hypothetical protein